PREVEVGSRPDLAQLGPILLRRRLPFLLLPLALAHQGVQVEEGGTDAGVDLGGVEVSHRALEGEVARADSARERGDGQCQRARTRRIALDANRALQMPGT